MQSFCCVLKNMTSYVGRNKHYRAEEQIHIAVNNKVFRNADDKLLRISFQRPHQHLFSSSSIAYLSIAFSLFFCKLRCKHTHNFALHFHSHFQCLAHCVRSVCRNCIRRRYAKQEQQLKKLLCLEHQKHHSYGIGCPFRSYSDDDDFVTLGHSI